MWLEVFWATGEKPHRHGLHRAQHANHQARNRFGLQEILPRHPHRIGYENN
jgi:hypothetical protein